MKSLVLVFLLALSFLATVPSALAQSTSPSPTAPPAPSIAPGADPATATRAWLDTVPPDKKARSDAYFEGGYWLILWNFLLNAAIAIFLLASGISARLRDFAERIARSKWLQVLLYAILFVMLKTLLGFPWSVYVFIILLALRLSARMRDFADRVTRSKGMQVMLYAIAFLIINAVLTFPLSVYEGFYREHQYGLATQTFGGWFGDQLKGLGFALIGLPLLLIVLYSVFRKAPRTWWIWAAAIVSLFSLVVSFILPVFILPAFNKYTPLEDPAIREPILALARANQIPVDKVFVVDASRQTTRVSANVAGFLGTTRIALNDNLLKQCTLPEIRHVMGHEMGHYVLNHGAKLVIYSAIVILLGLGLTNLGFNVLLQKRGAAWGVRGIGDPAGLPMILLIFATFSFLATPIRNTTTRVTEAEADIFGLNTAREPDAAAKVALKLGTYRKLDPTPMEEFIFFDHPSGRARIRAAMDWKAAHLPAGGTE